VDLVDTALVACPWRRQRDTSKETTEEYGEKRKSRVSADLLFPVNASARGTDSRVNMGETEEASSPLNESKRSKWHNLVSRQFSWTLEGSRYCPTLKC
jgi:hypothetical protein